MKQYAERISYVLCIIAASPTLFVCRQNPPTWADLIDLKCSAKKQYVLKVEFSYFSPSEGQSSSLRVRTVAKRHKRSSMFTASFIVVSCVKLP